MLGNLTSALANIRPAIEQVTGVPGNRNSGNKAFVQGVADRNAKDAAANLWTRSSVLSALGKKGELSIVSAMHDVSTGAVAWFG